MNIKRIAILVFLIASLSAGSTVFMINANERIFPVEVEDATGVLTVVTRHDETLTNAFAAAFIASSYNTFGMSAQMAYWYLNQPDVITRMHGSLAQLTGSKAYEEMNKRVKLKKDEE